MPAKRLPPVLLNLAPMITVVSVVSVKYDVVRVLHLLA